MPKRTVVYIVCSLCQKESADPEGFWDVKLDCGTKDLYAFDVCYGCFEGVFEPLIEQAMVSRKVTPPKQPKEPQEPKRATDQGAAVCHCGQAFKNARGLKRHQTIMHGGAE